MGILHSFIEERPPLEVASGVPEYPVLDLPGALVAENREPLGSKEKVWLRDPEDAQPRVLFKYNRPDTGEDWAEKIAAELAELLGLPHSHAELATLRGRRGTALLDFTENGHVALVHGNELLEFVDPDYPTQQRHRAVEHTIAAVANILSRPSVGLPETARPLPEKVTDALGLFVGYLLLDAWIGNTDRHHENWGLLWRDGGLVLAPTYDHASSLGRELSDDARTRPGNAAHGTPVERYARRAKSAFYPGAGQKEPLRPWVAFQVSATYRPDAANAWLDRLRQVPPEAVVATVDAVPSTHITRTARDFACALLAYNVRLLGI